MSKAEKFLWFLLLVCILMSVLGCLYIVVQLDILGEQSSRFSGFLVPVDFSPTYHNLYTYWQRLYKQ